MTRFLTPLAAQLPATVPFTGPETLERTRGQMFRARLGANESLFGPSPQAIAALQSAAPESWMYGDPDVHALKSAIAAHHGIAADHIVVGEGIDGLLGYLVRLTVDQTTHVTTSNGAYPTFNFHVAGFGGTLARVPYAGWQEDPAALLHQAKASQARLLYLANPDNPMGSAHPGAVIEDLVANLPAETLLVLDEAYIDFAPPGTLPQISANHPQVIRFRTFSKAYGLAGLRIGYAITHPALAAAFDRVRNHFGLGRPVQAAALAALQDQPHLARVLQAATAARLRLQTIGAANGLNPLPSATNFVTFDTGRDGAYARALLSALQAEGVFVRMPGVAPLDRCLRISLGDDAAMAVLEQALPRAVKACA